VGYDKAVYFACMRGVFRIEWGVDVLDLDGGGGDGVCGGEGRGSEGEGHMLQLGIANGDSLR
jgi:hypothetical protein